MVDVLTSEERSRRMGLVRQRNTAPEIAVRRLLHRDGFRFRLGDRHLPGSPDIVLPKWRTVIFVHGCFWHGHDCLLCKLPATRPDWWRAKLESNEARDKRSVEQLIFDGWRVVVVWQCALKGKGRLSTPEFSDALAAAVRGGNALIELRGTERRDWR